MWSCIRVLYSFVFSSITVYFPLGTIHMFVIEYLSFLPYCHFVLERCYIFSMNSFCDDDNIMSLMCFWSPSQSVAMLSEVSLPRRSSISVRRKNYQYPRLCRWFLPPPVKLASRELWLGGREQHAAKKECKPIFSK